MPGTCSEAAADDREGGGSWVALAVLVLPALLLSLDSSVLYLALPALEADLRPTSTQLLWILDGYGFMIAGFLVTMGTLGDRIGRRRLLMAGAAAFGAASVLTAYATGPAMLIAGRMLLGTAGATLMPTTLSLITVVFREPRRRTMAVGLWMACFMAGTVIGPLIGGILLRHAWWGSVFLLGVPVMVVLVLTAPAVLPEYRDGHPGRLDPLSVLLSLAAVLPTVHGLKEFASGRGSAAGAALFLAGPVLGALFVRRQRRLARPLLDVQLFAVRSLRAVLVILFLGGVVMGGIGPFTAQYLQLGEGLDPLTAGLWMLPWAAAMLLGSVFTPLAVRRLPPGTLIAAGLALASAGLLSLVGIGAGGMAVLVTGLTVTYLGLAPSAVLGADLVLSSAPAAKAGSASALSETGSELGVALGTAVLGSIGAAVYRSRMADAVPVGPAGTAHETFADAVFTSGDLPPGTREAVLTAARRAFTDGFALAALACAVLTAALAVLALVRLRRTPGNPVPDTAPDMTGSAG